MVILVVAFQSCNQNASLQTYYVDNELAPGFTNLDIPVSMLKIDETTLTKTQKEAYESIEKLSLLAFVADETNTETMNLELAKVQAILKQTKYEELMRGGNSTDGKFIVKCIGDGDNVDEFILFGNSNESGFAIVRVLGDDMNFSKIMELSTVFNESDVGSEQLEKITKFFK